MIRVTMRDLGLKLFALLRTAVFYSIVMYGLGVWLPWRLGLFTRDIPYDGISALRLVGILPLLIGFLVATQGAFAFAWTGHGTPAPFDPPRRLVVVGTYRFVRNPMYFGVATFLLGEAILFTRSPWGPLVYLGVFVFCVTVFVLIYEEPTLRSMFGADYDEYCRNVRRWLPRLHPWTPPQSRSSSVGTGS
jgi:protein-S-isoprenylcysteine O-methyltransferase Ste14